jgi:glycosyltransferase involved in cell wall biosynthesis
VEDVLAACEEAIGRGARLRIAGDGPERPRLERLADELGLREGVEFLGWIRDATDVAAFWQACDLGVAAPNDWVESFGLTVVEAMACGTPVIVTRGGALPETIVDGETGFVVEPRDRRGLAAALGAYLEDPTLVAEHGAAARAWCERRFDIDRCAEAYAGLFRPGQGDRHGESTPVRLVQAGDASEELLGAGRSS